MTANAAIYAPTATIIDPEQLQAIVGQAQVTIISGPTGNASQIRVKWDNCNVTINVMSPDRVSAHLKGFAGFIDAIRDVIGPVDADKEREIVGLVERVTGMKQVLGLVIEPGLDKDGNCKRLVRGITAHYDGLFFAHDAIYDSSGIPILGPKGAPNYT